MSGQERGNAGAAGNNLILCAVVDAVVSRANPESAFALAAPAIRQADIAFCPALVNKQGQPEVLPQADARSRDVLEYMDGMCRDLGARLSFEGDEVRVFIPVC